MSGTSCDGVDVAAIETDGYDYVRPLGFLSIPYDDEARSQVRACFGRQDIESNDIKSAERLLALKHSEAVNALLFEMGDDAKSFDFCGFHGQTIYHAPDDGVTIQIGDGELLAEKIGIDVVCDFRGADVNAGGQGAPLAPLYHRARMMSADVNLPVVVLNIGGVSNVTWMQGSDVVAFDCGPGNALMDDYIQGRTGAAFDRGGELAKKGQSIDFIVKKWLSNSYFSDIPPKSLDRDEWDVAYMGRNIEGLSDVSVEDGLATLSAFTVQGILSSLQFFPEPPKAWYVCGGGRHNTFLMESLASELEAKNAGMLHDVSDLGWNGDAVEAECFAYLAIRSILGEPLSLPSTTGVQQPQTGGVLVKVV